MTSVIPFFVYPTWMSDSNMPDLPMLLILADHYGLKIGEILNVEEIVEEREDEEMDKDTVKKVIEYADEERAPRKGPLFYYCKKACVSVEKLIR